MVLTNTDVIGTRCHVSLLAQPLVFHDTSNRRDQSYQTFIKVALHLMRIALNRLFDCTENGIYFPKPYYAVVRWCQVQFGWAYRAEIAVYA